MVVRVPDSIGNLVTKGHVVIPCQCYYSAANNLLTEIIQHSHHQHKDSDLSNIVKNHESEIKFNTKFKEKDPNKCESCCICEYCRNLKKSKNNKDIWNLQFNRWWGWNWQRKRKDLLNKFRFRKHNCASTSNSKQQQTNLHNEVFTNQSQYKDQLLENDTKESYIASKMSNEKESTKKNVSNITEFAERIKPIPPITLNGFKQPYVGRRRRRKRKNRLYEGWIREINSSDSEKSNENIKIKISSPKTPSNNKEYMNYLSLRLQNINSDESVNKDCLVSEKQEKVESEIKHSDFSKYISPFSGKYYNLTLPSVSVPFTETNETDCLQSVDYKDQSFIPKPSFDWLNHYKLMKAEHSALLKSICDALCSQKRSETENVEIEFKNIDYLKFKTSEINNYVNNISSKEQTTNQSDFKILDFQNISLPTICSTNDNIQENYENMDARQNNNPTNPFLNFNSKAINCCSEDIYREYNVKNQENALLNNLDSQNTTDKCVCFSNQDIFNKSNTTLHDIKHADNIQNQDLQKLSLNNENLQNICNKYGLHNTENNNLELMKDINYSTNSYLQKPSSLFANKSINYSLQNIFNKNSLNIKEKEADKISENLQQNYSFKNLDLENQISNFEHKVIPYRSLRIPNGSSVKIQENLINDKKEDIKDINSSVLNLKTGSLNSNMSTKCSVENINSNSLKMEKVTFKTLGVTNLNTYNVQENLLELDNKTENQKSFESQLNFNQNFESTLIPDSQLYQCSLIKSEINNIMYCTNQTNLPNSNQLQPLFTSQSSSSYEDALQFPQPEVNDNLGCINENYNENYDINYISNNLLSFCSSISDTEFLICRSEYSLPNLTNITEDNSEIFLQAINLSE